MIAVILWLAFVPPPQPPTLDWGRLAHAIHAVEGGPPTNPGNMRRAAIADCLDKFGWHADPAHLDRCLQVYVGGWLHRKWLPLTVRNAAMIWRWGPNGTTHADPESYAERVENLYRSFP